MEAVEVRPPLSRGLTGAELRRWYWLKAELVGLARELGVPSTGGKLELTDRLAAALDGVPTPPQTTAVRTNAPQLSGELTAATTIPVGQRSSQQLRRYFESVLGPGFRFDGALREFIARGGSTLGDATEFWRAARSRPHAGPTEIEPQFELNRFVRAWHVANPGGSREQALAAWRDHRAKPVEARDRM